MHSISDSFCQRTNTSKPALPYLLGKCLTIRSHEPPAPTTGRRTYNPETARERETLHPLIRCQRHPPLPGKDGQVMAEVEIIRPIRAGDKYSTQLVAVRVKSSCDKLPKDIDVVAKIYDPLYFDHDQDDADPFPYLDHDYSHEAAAYKALAELQGGIIPKFFGSFSIRIPVDTTAFRSVRLILIEFIPGHSIQQLGSANLSQPLRQTIMKEVINAESLIYTNNVLHQDMRPSNVLICGVPELKRIVIIDFGHTVLGRHAIPSLHK